MKFDDVVAILDKSVGGPDADVASHGPFWRGVTRDRFVEMKVGGRKLVTLGDGANSNLVLSLKGEAPFGSDLDDPPAGAVTPQCPHTSIRAGGDNQRYRAMDKRGLPGGLTGPILVLNADSGPDYPQCGSDDPPSW